MIYIINGVKTWVIHFASLAVVLWSAWLAETYTGVAWRLGSLDITEDLLKPLGPLPHYRIEGFNGWPLIFPPLFWETPVSRTTMCTPNRCVFLSIHFLRRPCQTAWLCFVALVEVTLSIGMTVLFRVFLLYYIYIYNITK